MSNKAVRYAEDILEVHEVFDKASSVLEDMDRLRANITKLVSEKRELADKILDREAVLTIEERGNNPQMSATAFESHIKTARRNDAQLMIYRHQQREVQGGLDESDSSLAHLKEVLETLRARMVELNGYLVYLAAAKNAETQAKEPHDSSSNWPSIN